MYRQRFNNLREAWKDDFDVLDIIERTICSFGQYIEVIMRMEAAQGTRTSMIGDSSNYITIIESLDKSRKIIHDSIMTNLKIVNRLAEQKGLPPIYEGGLDTKNRDDRFYVGEFLNKVSNEYFETRKK